MGRDIQAVADRLGFHEDAALLGVRAQVLAAIREADLAGYRAAWRRYQELAEAQIDKLPESQKWAKVRMLPAKARIGLVAVRQAGPIHPYRAWRQYQQLSRKIPTIRPFARGQIGLILAKATIWRSSHNRARYWEELSDAWEYARGMRYPDVDEVASAALDRASNSRSFYGEYLQATRQYDEAISEYIEREQDECLTDRERGLVNLRLAECYMALMDEPGSDDDNSLLGLLGATIESALLYLVGESEHAYARRLFQMSQDI